MPKFWASGALAAMLAAAVALTVPAAAQADSVVAPQVYVRLIDPNNATIGITPWQPLSATLSSLGPYDIGVKLQPESAANDGQAIQVNLTSQPPASLPSNWTQLQPYSPYCKYLAGTAGAIQSTGATLYYQGNGAYSLSVAAYTAAQHNATTGPTCSGGPPSAVTLAVDALPSASILGKPLAPRTTRKAVGFNGFRMGLPVGDEGYRWRCARDPVLTSNGPVSGTLTTQDSDNTESPNPTDIDEGAAFTSPGRWACSVQALGGDIIGDAFPTPWVTSPMVVIHGEFARDQTRTSLRRLPHRQMRLTVPAIRSIAKAAAHGALTLTIYRATCASIRTGTIKLRKVLRRRVRLDRRARAVFNFRSPASDGYYLGRLTFGGTTLVLAGPDADMFLGLSAPANPRAKATIQFVDPSAWGPCL